MDIFIQLGLKYIILLLTIVCGIPNREDVQGKIVFGDETEMSEYPWQVGSCKGNDAGDRRNFSTS